MDFSRLSPKNKKEALEQSLYALQQELYTSLVKVNIDPDTFVIEEWEEPSPVLNHDYHRITQLIDGIIFTQNKLKEFA